MEQFFTRMGVLLQARHGLFLRKMHTKNCQIPDLKKACVASAFKYNLNATPHEKLSWLTTKKIKLKGF